MPDVLDLHQVGRSHRWTWTPAATLRAALSVPRTTESDWTQEELDQLDEALAAGARLSRPGDPYVLRLHTAGAAADYCLPDWLWRHFEAPPPRPTAVGNIAISAHEHALGAVPGGLVASVLYYGIPLEPAP